jgi:hypothetical protein
MLGNLETARTALLVLLSLVSLGVVLVASKRFDVPYIWRGFVWFIGITVTLICFVIISTERNVILAASSSGLILSVMVLGGLYRGVIRQRMIEALTRSPGIRHRLASDILVLPSLLTGFRGKESVAIDNRTWRRLIGMILLQISAVTMLLVAFAVHYAAGIVISIFLLPLLAILWLRIWPKHLNE